MNKFAHTEEIAKHEPKVARDRGQIAQMSSRAGNIAQLSTPAMRFKSFLRTNKSLSQLK